MFVSGFVSVVGRPNVGKSTLINSLVGKKVVIVSDKPQTTRNRIQAVLTTPRAQVVFVDTPGFHKPKHQLGEYMVKAALDSLQKVDLVLFMVEALFPPGRGDRYIAEMLKELKMPAFLVVNKIDLAPPDFRESWLPLYEKLLNFKRCFLISALREENTMDLLEGIIQELPPGPLFYPPEMVTDRPEGFQIGEIIREKILARTREEVPHSVAVEIERLKRREDKDLLEISAVIYVEKESQKKIIIGKEGQMLKEIGSEARRELENLLGSRIFLELWVKVKESWRRKENVLRQLGYN